MVFFLLNWERKKQNHIVHFAQKTSNFHVNEILKIIFRNSMIDITISIENACAKRRMLL